MRKLFNKDNAIIWDYNIDTDIILKSGFER